jgi:ubiquinone/menaquinone biosynthesis C-methylase UbiE
MPSIDENIESWGEAYDWPERGDEWSEPWGGTAFLWHGTILPRIQAFLPAGHLVEIAPGQGRCTQFLKDLCERLTVVDLNQRCIDECRRRFADAANVEYLRNDGRSLEGIADESVDFAFSWDSLVHAEMDVVEAYLAELRRVLAPGGWGFLHHSNLGAWSEEERAAAVETGWRAASVSADAFDAACRANGLSCVVQETVVARGSERPRDCFSLFTREAGHPREVVANRFFAVEAELLSALSRLRESVTSLYRRPPR